MDLSHSTSPGTLLITGGRGDLAQAIVRIFKKSNWNVLNPGRDELDVTSASSIEHYLSRHAIDLLICNAGIQRDQWVARTQESAWDEVLHTNLRGAAWSARNAIPGMLRRRRGHLVFISSYSALHPPQGQAAYAASKAGLIGLTRSLAREFGSKGLRANAILPGFLETRMTATVSPQRVQEVMAEHCLRRFNTPEAVARFLLTLEQDMPHTSGQVFQLDSRVA